MLSAKIKHSNNISSLGGRKTIGDKAQNYFIFKPLASVTFFFFLINIYTFILGIL